MLCCDSMNRRANGSATVWRTWRSDGRPGQAASAGQLVEIELMGRDFFMEPGETFARLRHAAHSECGRAVDWAGPARTPPFRARCESRPSVLGVEFPGLHRPVQNDAHAPQSTAGQVLLRFGSLPRRPTG